MSERCNCSELLVGENVVFSTKDFERDKIFDGNVLTVNPKERTVTVIYLNGYRSCTDTLPYEKMIARYDKNGKNHTFGGWITGPSVLLDAK